jgi:hypothetical protein
MNTQNNLAYCGSFSTIQTNGDRTLLNYGAPTYSDKQKELYNRALVGLKAYSEEELYAMNSTKKKRIKKVHKKAQAALNAFKQRRTIALLKRNVETMIPNLKPDSLLGKLINADNVIDEKAINKFSLKKLKIKKEQIIELWISEGVLPSNFYSL